MRSKHVPGLAIALMVVGGSLSVLSGCAGEKAESIAESEAEPMEGGQATPDLEPEGPDSRLVPPEAIPDKSLSPPAWPEPDIVGADPLPVQPLIDPDFSQDATAPSLSPSLPDLPQADVSPWGGGVSSPAMLPSPIRSFAVDPEPRFAPPDDEPLGGGPVLFAPGNLSESAEPVGIRPKPRMAPPRFAEGSYPTSIAPQPMLAPAAVPDAGGGEPMAMEPRIARPSVEIFPPEPAPVAVSSGGGLSATAEEFDAKEEVEAEKEDYQVVSVFYGTDRMPTDMGQSERRGYLGWLYLSASCAVITLALIVAAYRLTRRLPLLLLAGTGVAATLVFGAITTLSRFPGEPVGPRPDWTYGDERGELEMGICKVSIPEHHQMGAIERPSVFRFELREDPREHIVVLALEEQPADTFFAGLRERVEASPRKEAFVFVHGFNTTFDEAAYRTAQLAHDLKFEGAPIFFSWPSQGGLLEYAIDETNVVWAVPHLKDFLIDVARRSGANSVHLVAHSMGNRALTSALQLLSYELRDEPPMFREVVLTAPDVDAEVFRRDIVPAIVPTAGRVTLYASSNDEALKLSKALHGYRRAGDSGGELLVISGVDTVDVSTVDTSLLGHEYYGNNQTVIADMLDLINESKPPHLRRFLEAKRMGELFYWVFHGDPQMLGTSQPAEPSVRR